MSRIFNLIGNRFGKLTVTSKCSSKTNSGLIKWNCVCDCGNKTIVIGSNLRRGYTTSCGCINRENARVMGESNKTHSQSRTKIYRVWCNIIQQCTNPNNPDYPVYGGRGIIVDERWQNDFKAFYEDVGPPPTETCILRRQDTDKSFNKDNCYWVDRPSKISIDKPLQIKQSTLEYLSRYFNIKQ